MVRASVGKGNVNSAEKKSKERPTFALAAREDAGEEPGSELAMLLFAGYRCWQFGLRHYMGTGS